MFLRAMNHYLTVSFWLDIRFVWRFPCRGSLSFPFLPHALLFILTSIKSQENKIRRKLLADNGWAYGSKSTVQWNMLYLVFRLGRRAAGGIRTRWGGGRRRRMLDHTQKQSSLDIKNNESKRGRKVQPKNKILFQSPKWFVMQIWGHNGGNVKEMWNAFLTLLDFFFSFFFFCKRHS